MKSQLSFQFMWKWILGFSMAFAMLGCMAGCRRFDEEAKATIVPQVRAIVNARQVALCEGGLAAAGRYFSWGKSSWWRLPNKEVVRDAAEFAEIIYQNNTRPHLQSICGFWSDLHIEARDWDSAWYMGQLDIGFVGETHVVRQSYREQGHVLLTSQGWRIVRATWNPIAQCGNNCFPRK